MEALFYYQMMKSLRMMNNIQCIWLMPLMFRMTGWGTPTKGAGSLPFRRHFKNFMQENWPKIVVLMEPRIHGYVADNVVARLGFPNSYRIKTHGFKAEFEFQPTIVYMSPSYAFRKHIWSKISQVKPSLDVSWVIGGDFKAILLDEERVGGSIHTTRGSWLFRDFIFFYGLTDLGFKGPQFTWTRGNLHERMDCFLVNDQWMLNYGDVFVRHLDKLGFDHRPLLLRLSDDEDRGVNRPFHFISLAIGILRFSNILVSKNDVSGLDYVELRKLL
ncbi:hypothetical protein GQ457_01G019350 [Hibiscus cannabinus]